MKLVDILARELKEWPNAEYDSIGQSCTGTLHKSPNWDAGCGWSKESYTLAEDWSRAHVTRTQWKAAVDALKAAENAVPEWTGEGLPPVGTVCNYRESKVRILTHADQKDGPTLAVGQVGERGMMVFATAESRSFRPIRTPEQVAAEEIQKIRDEIKWRKPQLGPCPVEQMYLLGYRKFEIVDN